ncbi:MAG: hypothetical protein ACXU81_12440, partial [Myxococcaceae bacterium]
VALIGVLTAEQPAPTTRPREGLASDRVGVELSASVLNSWSSGTNSTSSALFPVWELDLRLRIGQFFSVGISAESFDGTTGGAGDEASSRRQEIGIDLQWRFWGFGGVLRPWLGVGMAWGNIYWQHQEDPDVYRTIDAHVWEFLRFSAGLDLVPWANFAIGPWVRHGFASTRGPYDTGTSLETTSVGLRLTVAIP